MRVRWTASLHRRDATTRARGITGLLVFGSGIFFQWLEGPRDNVLELMEVLKTRPAPPRGRAVETRGEEVRERLFPDWDMELVTGDDVRNVLEDALDQAHDANSAQVLRAMLEELESGQLSSIGRG